MPKHHIQSAVTTALKQLQASSKMTLPEINFHIEVTKDPQFGDFACNIAMPLAKHLKKDPLSIAQMVVAAIPNSPFIEKIEIKGPGFINFFLTPRAFQHTILDILQAKDTYGHSNAGQSARVLVEFLSANPNGPLHIGHGRHAAFGAVIAELLAATGYKVHKEYYVNDAGRQMDIVTVSTWLRYLEHCGEKIIFPVNGYKGDYVHALAQQLFSKESTRFHLPYTTIFADLPADESDGGDKEIYIDALIVKTKSLLGQSTYQQIFDLVLNSILENIRQDLAEFGVSYDHWFSERAFVQSDIVPRTIEELKNKNLVYTQDGALWFRATQFNDEKDRVVQRANGIYTYFANDLAYHINKFARGFDYALDIFGADHHGYIPRMQAGIQAYGIALDRLNFLLVQFVTLYRGKQQVQMSTRSGSFITLRELREEVGNDAARFFYIMRKCEQHIDFDLDLAKSKSNENPVYYIQYAHARICSVLRQSQEKEIPVAFATDVLQLASLTTSEELQLLATLARYPDVISQAAKAYEPHQLTTYLKELATSFHSYYNKHQFLVEEATVRNARLNLIFATRQVLKNGLKLIGVHAPESM